MIAAYAAVLHRVWIDNPSYVEDVLSESDEFVYLDSIRCHDHEDTFFFWSEQDSLDYENNLLDAEERAIILLRHYGNQNPDLIPPPAP